jgi:hypothetical protein
MNQLDREIESLNHLRALVDEESWVAEPTRWRAELGIESYPWERYEIPDTTVNYGSPAPALTTIVVKVKQTDGT